MLPFKGLVRVKGRARMKAEASKSEKREPRGASPARISSRGSSYVPSMEKLTEKYPSNYEFREEDKQKAASSVLKESLFGFLTVKDRTWLLYLIVIAMIVRLAFLNHPSVVIFDEVHFGGFAQKYINREFFNDLHPPLARLLVTLSAWIGRFDGKFSFYDIGADYLTANVPYVTMRAFTALSGVAVIPIAFVTMRALGVTFATALSVSTMLIFDNALMTQSRLILLDSYLVLFTALLGLSWALFENQRGR